MLACHLSKGENENIQAKQKTRVPQRPAKTSKILL